MKAHKIKEPDGTICRISTAALQEWSTAGFAKIFSELAGRQPNPAELKAFADFAGHGYSYDRVSSAPDIDEPDQMVLFSHAKRHFAAAIVFNGKFYSLPLFGNNRSDKELFDLCTEKKTDQDF